MTRTKTLVTNSPNTAKPAQEVNFDGLVGPTHSYAGLSFGNVASVSHKAALSNPREAVLQGLRKMKELSNLGFPQSVLPPQERPDLITLRGLGFRGTDQEILDQAWKKSPELLAACASASAMWTANAATVAPSADTQDGRVHFTAANLINKFHRSLEARTTERVLRSIFRNEEFFSHHRALEAGGSVFSDEGAANHTRFCREYGEKGIHFFVFGRSAFHPERFPEPTRFPARQSLEASEAIARLHLLSPQSVVFAQQNPEAIDAGAFHNDVVAVGNGRVLFFHEKAFARKEETLGELDRKLRAQSEVSLIPIEVPASEVSLKDAVQSYLFNSQLLALPGSGSEPSLLLIAPHECEEVESVKSYLSSLIDSKSTPIREVRLFDLRQSMRNGGGPACLRLRVVLTAEERAHALPGVFMSDALYTKLVDWANRHYRDRLSAEDLRDAKLYEESRRALDELTSILGLGSVYPFQFPSAP